MSIQSEINRITTNINQTLSIVAGAGVAVPAGSNSNDLPALVSQLSGQNTPVALVTVTSGAHVVAVNGSKTVEGYSVNGICELKLPSFGVWSLIATLDDEVSKPGEIIVLESYPIELKFGSGPEYTLVQTFDVTSTTHSQTVTMQDRANNYLYIRDVMGNETVIKASLVSTTYIRMYMENGGTTSIRLTTSGTTGIYFYRWSTSIMLNTAIEVIEERIYSNGLTVI